MTTELIFPQKTEPSIDAISQRLEQSRDHLLAPFSDTVMEFFSRLSRHLFTANQPHQFPELQALAFWMRSSALRRMRESFLQTLHREVFAAPRGLSFHVTPSNVDTMPIYSLLLSLICGNSNVVRVSRRSGPQFELVLSCIKDLFDSETKFAGVSNLITLLRYDRSNLDLTAALSDQCDTRVLWGGDEAVDEIRRSPISRDAIEVVFPDRVSWAVMPALHWNGLDANEREKLLHHFFNDTLALDQLACSSPQTFVWVGNAADCEIASQSFWEGFNQLSEQREYAIDGATNIKKLTTVWNVSMDADVTQVRQLTKVTVMNVTGDHKHRGCGAGFFYELHVDSLNEILSLVGSRDQTLAYAGFDRQAILAVATQLRGKGFSKFTPIGTALEFSPLWEGKDLLHAFTQLIHVR